MRVALLTKLKNLNYSANILAFKPFLLLAVAYNMWVSFFFFFSWIVLCEVVGSFIAESYARL